MEKAQNKTFLQKKYHIYPVYIVERCVMMEIKPIGPLTTLRRHTICTAWGAGGGFLW
jgi:hypothetical protein